MYTLRLLIIIFLMTASNLYAQQREDDKANSVIMSSQANRLIERGEYEEALKLLQKAEKTYSADNDTLTASFIVVFLAPQFECYRMMKRYEEATYISYRIMMINRKKATRSEIQPNNRETRQRKTEALSKAPVKAAEDDGDDYDIDYVLAVACALTLIYAVMATGFLSHYIHRARRKDKAQMQILGRLQRYKRLLYGYEKGEYYLLLGKVLAEGKTQQNKKGKIKYLLNEQLTLTPADLLDIFESHGIARKKLKEELKLFMQGERNVERYREAGIAWWDYCGQTLVNSYPTYMEKLPPLIERINKEKRNSKNYVLFLGATDAESNQAPCLSLVQFQIEDGALVVSAYQRSSDANLGLPSDIYHLYLMARQIDLPLKSITLNLANVHIYENNIKPTERLLAGEDNIKFELNV